MFFDNTLDSIVVLIMLFCVAAGIASLVFDVTRALRAPTRQIARNVSLASPVDMAALAVNAAVALFFVAIGRPENAHMFRTEMGFKDLLLAVAIFTAKYYGCAVIIKYKKE